MEYSSLEEIMSELINNIKNIKIQGEIFWWKEILI